MSTVTGPADASPELADLLTGILHHVTQARAALAAGADATAQLDAIQRAAEAATVVSRHLRPTRLSRPDNPAPSTLGAGFIVIAEDEPMVAELTRRILVHAGFAVRVTPNGLAALELIREARDAVAMLVSDIVMPEMTGLELAKALSSERPSLPVLLVSGYPDDADRHHDETLARTPFLPKPYKAADLIAAVEGLLARARP